MYSIPTEILIGEQSFNITNKGDYRMVLDCFSALEDPKLSKEQRIITSLLIFYEDLQEPSDLSIFPDLEVAVKEMYKFFKEKADARKNGIKRMKDAIKWAMINLNLDKIEAGNYTIKLQSNGGKLPLQIIGEVPDNFKRIIYEDDTELIRKHLENGETLGFAYLEERGKHVVIK